MEKEWNVTTYGKENKMRSIKEVIYRIKPDVDMITVDFIDHHLFYAYSEYFRHYHNCEEHIIPILKIFDDGMRELCDDPDLVEFAWWYHDFIYIPGAPFCEDLSAERARFDGINLKFEEEKYNLIHYLILATKYDIEKDLHLNDEQIIHDLDLVIFALEQQKYDKYVEQIRQEYSFIYEHDFTKGRLEILKKFIKRKTIYCHKYFINKYEKKARENLNREIDFLKNRVEL